MGNILTLAYKKSLLASLIPIRYEDTINSINDLDNSGLPLLLPEGSMIHNHFSSDTRPIMRRIFNRSILYNFNEGDMPHWALEI